MIGIRFYLRWENGDVTDDELCPVPYNEISKIEKSFTLLGEKADIVFEFDPPLQPVEQTA